MFYMSVPLRRPSEDMEIIQRRNSYSVKSSMTSLLPLEGVIARDRKDQLTPERTSVLTISADEEVDAVANQAVSPSLC